MSSNRYIEIGTTTHVCKQHIRHTQTHSHARALMMQTMRCVQLLDHVERMSVCEYIDVNVFAYKHTCTIFHPTHTTVCLSIHGERACVV